MDFVELRQNVNCPTRESSARVTGLSPCSGPCSLCWVRVLVRVLVLLRVRVLTRVLSESECRVHGRTRASRQSPSTQSAPKNSDPGPTPRTRVLLKGSTPRRPLEKCRTHPSLMWMVKASFPAITIPKSNEKCSMYTSPSENSCVTSSFQYRLDRKAREKELDDRR